MDSVSVIIPAAGSGTRFGALRNKIFEPLAGRAIFLRTLERFARRPDVVQVQLVVSAADHRDIEHRYGAELVELGAQLTIGGGHRGESVANALARVCDEATLVCVHDAVRPCASDERIDAVFAAAARSGAAMLAWPVHATLKRVGPGGVITETVSREGLWEAQTPQVFARELLVRAYAVGAEAATDDAQLVEAIGHSVLAIEGDPRNIKITTPADLALAEAIWPTL
jgi:2-C-methyl-D-erythritol 4-phosphate cytidylyltransferase